MIWADSINKYYTDTATGDRYGIANLFSDDVPSPFPNDFSEVKRLGDKEPFDPNLKIGTGSTLITAKGATPYMMDSTGNWNEW